MARIALKCSCGWTFFVPGTTAEAQADCPSCGAAVPIPGRKPGQAAPASAGQIASEKQRQQSFLRLAVGLGLLVVVAGGISTYVLTRPGPPPLPEPEPAARTRPPVLPVPRPPSPEALPIPVAPPDLYSSGQIEDLRREVQTRIWQINMTSLVSEALRLRNMTSEWAQMQAAIAGHEGKIRTSLVELAKAGQKVPLEPYFAQGDQIVAFAQKDLTGLKPEDAAGIIQLWLARWRAGASLEQVGVLRGDKKLVLYLFFPEELKELTEMAHYPPIAVDPAGPAGDPGTFIPELPALPADLLREIQTRLDGLPPGYRNYILPTDRRRLDGLLQNRKGSPDDVEWLQSFILGEMLPSFRKEADALRAKVVELEPKLKESVAADVIYRKNGTKVEGQITKETPEAVFVKIRGLSGPIPREEIQRIEKGKGVEAEFPARYAEAKGSVEKLSLLLAWCAEKNLRIEKEYVAAVLLSLDASHDKARAALALSRPVIGSPAAAARNVEAARVDLVDQTVDLIARDVVSKNLTYADVIREMQRRTETLKTSLAPAPPDNVSRGLSVIGNPLTFRPQNLPVPTALEIGTWWTSLTTEDRRSFAKYFGLWCAFYRGQRR